MAPTGIDRADAQAFPYRQLTVLALCRICEPIAFMSIFPYIYYMIESFHVTDNDKQIAFYAGMVTSAFALAEAMSSSTWGRLSDKFGRKPILLSGLAGTGLSVLAFGFARSLPFALIARALGGLLNGNIGVLQTTVAEVVKNEAHQGIAFALMPTVWCVGAVIGSGLGGGLADPVRNYPDLFGKSTLFARYPYLLPNLVCATLVVVGIVVGILFLEETHEDLQDRKDSGLQLGKWIERRFTKRPRQICRESKPDITAETFALLHECDDQPPDYRSAASSPGLQATAVALPPPYQSIGLPLESAELELTVETDLADAEFGAASRTEVAKRRQSSIWSVMSRQLVLNIVGLGILAYHTISAEQLLPVLFSMPESEVPPHLPFQFTGGFALSTKTIGGILSLQGLIQIIATIGVFPVVQRRLGTLRTFRMVVLTYPFLYILVPYLTLVPVNLRRPAIYAILVWKVTAQAFTFPALNMMLANIIPKRALGTGNGFAQSSASLARAFGPSLSGLLQSMGLSHGMLGLPWWCNALVALLGAVLSLFMVEERRRAHDPEKDEDDDVVGPTAFSPEVNAALVAAESSNAAAHSTLSRPTSPLLVRLSMDIRRSTRRDSKT